MADAATDPTTQPAVVKATPSTVVPAVVPSGPAAPADAAPHRQPPAPTIKNMMDALIPADEREEKPADQAATDTAEKPTVVPKAEARPDAPPPVEKSAAELRAEDREAAHQMTLSSNALDRLRGREILKDMEAQDLAEEKALRESMAAESSPAVPTFDIEAVRTEIQKAVLAEVTERYPRKQAQEWNPDKARMMPVFDAETGEPVYEESPLDSPAMQEAIRSETQRRLDATERSHHETVRLDADYNKARMVAIKTAAHELFPNLRGADKDGKRMLKPNWDSDKRIGRLAKLMEDEIFEIAADHIKQRGEPRTFEERAELRRASFAHWMKNNLPEMRELFGVNGATSTSAPTATTPKAESEVEKAVAKLGGATPPTPAPPRVPTAGPTIPPTVSPTPPLPGSSTATPPTIRDLRVQAPGGVRRLMEFRESQQAAAGVR